MSVKTKVPQIKTKTPLPRIKIAQAKNNIKSANKSEMVTNIKTNIIDDRELKAIEEDKISLHNYNLSNNEVNDNIANNTGISTYIIENIECDTDKKLNQEVQFISTDIDKKLVVEIQDIKQQEPTTNNTLENNTETSLILSDSSIILENTNNISNTVKSIRFSIRNKYSFLSNFYSSEFTIDNVVYNHVEGYYQSQKFILYDPKAAKHISTVLSPMACKKIAYSYYLPINKKLEWDSDLKDKVMKRALYAKFSTNTYLLQALLDTKNNNLIEDSTIDKYWGQDKNGNGENKLGILLMEVRSTLQNCI